MFRCNVSLVRILLIMVITLLIAPYYVFSQTEQTPIDRDIPKIPDEKREPAPIAPDQGATIKQEKLNTDNDSIPIFTMDTSFDSLDSVLSSDSLASEEPVLAKKEFLFTNLDMRVTALSFIMWVVMMCWAAFSS